MLFLETERLYLRNLNTSDRDTIFDYRNNKSCNQYQRWTALTASEIEDFILAFSEDSFLSEKKEQHYAICEKESSHLVGELAYFYTANDCITLGITISYRYHKKGFAYEMLSSAIQAIRRSYPSLDIVALIEKENINSIRLFEKLGFHQETYAESIASYVYVLYA